MVARLATCLSSFLALRARKLAKSNICKGFRKQGKNARENAKNYSVEIHYGHIFFVLFFDESERKNADEKSFF